MPETPATSALEESLANNARDRAIRRSIADEFGAGRVNDAEALESAGLLTLRVRQGARVRPRVDQDPPGREDPMNLA
ncbi:MAG: hypothetical protein E6I00_16135 [Chloroflexi bacterium]|nr:MAG: hypothetical protein E6I00_16135 [Chloroflexota bacterium]